MTDDPKKLIRETFRHPPEVTPFAPAHDSRNIVIAWSNPSPNWREKTGLRVLCQGVTPDQEHVVNWLARAPQLIRELELEVETLGKRLFDACGKIPPTKPRSIMGMGCIREAPGCLWLLNTAERGWSASGVRLEGWDDLFRRWDIVVGAPKTDETGQWWPAQPR